MRFVRKGFVLGAIALAAAITASAPAAAATATLYVNGKTGDDKNACTAPAAPCKTIAAAITKAEADAEAEAVMIEVAAGVYTEPLTLKVASSGVTINGAGSGLGGTEIEGPKESASPTVNMSAPGSTIALSNLSVVNDLKEDTGKGISIGAQATLTNVVVTMEEKAKASGIETNELGSLTMHGGGVTMEGASEGFGIQAALGPQTIDGASVLVASPSLAGGISAELSPSTITGTVVNIASTVSERPAIVATLAPVTLTGVSVTENGASLGSSPGLESVFTDPLTVNGVSVKMTNAGSKSAAVQQIFGTATFEQLSVSGAWKGLGFGAEGGNITLADSRITEGAGSTLPAAFYGAGAEVPGLVLRRSVLQAGPTAVPAALISTNGNVTLDSSEVLGGHSAILLEQIGGKAKTLTVAGSTLDAGNPGEADGGGTAITVGAGTNSKVSASVEGSILLEPQASLVAVGTAGAKITCSNSDVPSQSQAEGGTNGAIECASGSAGNTHTEPAALFSTPLTEYGLSPSASAVDAVPAGAIALPFGLTPSTTDLAGNPRVVDGNGDCLALQDKGAVELQGRSAPCPAPLVGPAPPVPTPKPLAGVISALTVSPRGFFAAPSGATVSARKSYGAKVSWRDTQAATTTFTVLQPGAGRMQGHTCKKPGRANRHGRRCTLYKALGTFTHADRAGANSLHFSGRLHAHRLARGSYRLQAVARDVAGRGPAASAGFTIR